MKTLDPKSYCKKDLKLIKVIAKIHKVDKAVVERHYKEMLIDITKIKKKKNQNRLMIIEILKNNLDEEYIEKFCTSIGKPKLSETIYLFLNNTLEETAEILGVDASTIMRRINTFIEESKSQ